MSVWKIVHENSSEIVSDCCHKMKVPGGYLYRSVFHTASGTSQSMCFVPAIDDEIDLDRLERLIFEGAQTHASILRCEAALKKIEEEYTNMRKYISDCDKSRFDADGELREQIEIIRGHLVL